jgi:hyperosmotically inducible periplasmic protein
MKKPIISRARWAVLAFAMSGAMLALSPSAQAEGQDEITSAIKAKLHAKQYNNVQVSVDTNGVATLSGTVDLFEYKADADRAAHKVKGVNAVRDEIQVGGASASDEEIQKKLGPALAYSREGYGNLFDAIIMNVQNGVVTLSGHAHDYPNRDAAVGLASTTPGVKEVVDNIEIDPLSPMDDGIRMQVARSIYGYPALNKYAIDPVRPIRIAVQNGHVQLYGTVINNMDRQLAYMQASQVPGVFSVDNHIQVEGQPNEQQEKGNPQMKPQAKQKK